MHTRAIFILFIASVLLLLGARDLSGAPAMASINFRKGAGTPKTLMNWDGGLSEIEFAAAVWLWAHRF